MDDVSEIVAKGEHDRARQEAERAMRDRIADEDCRERTVWQFHRCFFNRDDHLIPNPDKFAYARWIEDPGNPYPAMTDWMMLNPGKYRGGAMFTCEGIRYVCRYTWEGGGDRAGWDDGYWPEWHVIVSRRRRWLPFLRRDVHVPVYGPVQVAEAVEGTRG